MKTERYLNRRSARWLAGAGISALAATIAVPAAAQDNQGGDEDGPVILDSAPDQASSDEGIVVTGSRIRRNETTSASPLTIIDPTLQQKQGLNSTAEIIQQSPIANGSTQITSAISANTISNGGPGAATISLRGLGAERTLVLLNSRRAGPAGTRGGVSAFDLNVLPSAIIDRVDVLKDGASSIYGSDAVAGVVNILTKRRPTGWNSTSFARSRSRMAGRKPMSAWLGARNSTAGISCWRPTITTRRNSSGATAISSAARKIISSARMASAGST